MITLIRPLWVYTTLSHFPTFSELVEGEENKLTIYYIFHMEYNVRVQHYFPAASQEKFMGATLSYLSRCWSYNFTSISGSSCSCSLLSCGGGFSFMSLGTRAFYTHHRSKSSRTYCKEFASTFGVPSFLQSSLVLLYLFGAGPLTAKMLVTTLPPLRSPVEVAFHSTPLPPPELSTHTTGQHYTFNR